VPLRPRCIVGTPSNASRRRRRLCSSLCCCHGALPPRTPGQLPVARPAAMRCYSAVTAAAGCVSVPERRGRDRPPAHPSSLAILISKRGLCFCFACFQDVIAPVAGHCPPAGESGRPEAEACAMHRCVLRDRQPDPRATRYVAREATTRPLAVGDATAGRGLFVLKTGCVAACTTRPSQRAHFTRRPRFIRAASTQKWASRTIVEPVDHLRVLAAPCRPPDSAPATMSTFTLHNCPPPTHRHRSAMQNIDMVRARFIFRTYCAIPPSIEIASLPVRFISAPDTSGMHIVSFPLLNSISLGAWVPQGCVGKFKQPRGQRLPRCLPAWIRLNTTATAKIDLFPRLLELTSVRPYAAMYQSVTFRIISRHCCEHF
jgi:hypothetical protein